MKILEKALLMLEKYPLCDHCLGRQFALLGFGMDDEERGVIIKRLLVMEGHRLASSSDKSGTSILKTLASNGSSAMALEILKRLKKRARGQKKCYLCEGHFDSFGLVNKAAEMLKEYDYQTFLVGVRLPPEIEEREDEFKSEFQVEFGESIRNEFSRVFGKSIHKIAGKPVDYAKPEVVVLVNPFSEEIELNANPLFIMGRYRKLKRGIPQSVLFCPKCRGKGCSTCSWTGKMYAESVEELIQSPALREALGEGASFHAAGREDIDARMLGRGRPFILEVKRPKKRSLNLPELKEKINREAQGKIRVSNLRFVDKDALRKLKLIEGSEKLYKVIVLFDRAILDEELQALERTFTNVAIHQQTPSRVLPRRKDTTREKHIYKTEVRRLAENTVEMRIICQGGLYIKELVTGDEGRTKPNVADTIKAGARPLELDVLSVFTKIRVA